jgi:hypothetical protein
MSVQRESVTGGALRVRQAPLDVVAPVAGLMLDVETELHRYWQGFWRKLFAATPEGPQAGWEQLTF